MRTDPFAGIPAFVAVAERRSFTEAAADLGITSGAVSKAVSRLEEELGIQLLSRTTRRIEPTDEGLLYLRYCKDALVQMRTARDRVAQARATPAGELVVALPFLLGRTLAPLLPEFLERYPSLNLRLTFSDRPSELLDEGIDVALRIGDLEDTSHVTRKLISTRFITIASPAYLDRRGHPLSPEDLKGHDCLLYRSPRGFDVDWQFLDQPGSRKSRTATPRARVVVDHGELLVQSALSGTGIAQVFTFMVEDEVSRGKLVALLEPYACEGPPLHALCKAKRAKSKRVRAFLDYAIEKLAH